MPFWMRCESPVGLMTSAGAVDRLARATDPWNEEAEDAGGCCCSGRNFDADAVDGGSLKGDLEARIPVVVFVPLPNDDDGDDAAAAAAALRNNGDEDVGEKDAAAEAPLVSASVAKEEVERANRSFTDDDGRATPCIDAAAVSTHLLSSASHGEEGRVQTGDTSCSSSTTTVTHVADRRWCRWWHEEVMKEEEGRVVGAGSIGAGMRADPLIALLTVLVVVVAAEPLRQQQEPPLVLRSAAGAADDDDAVSFSCRALVFLTTTTPQQQPTMPACLLLSLSQSKSRANVDGRRCSLSLFPSHGLSPLIPLYARRRT